MMNIEFKGPLLKKYNKISIMYTHGLDRTMINYHCISGAILIRSTTAQKTNAVYRMSD